MKRIFNKIVLPDYSIKETKPFFKFQLMFFLFMASSVIGFIYEEIYCSLQFGKLCYRGFLWGTYLPVYGVGAILMYLFLNKLRNNPAVIFILSMAITGIVEYVTGTLLWRIFNKRWWDYSDSFLNINGYVCLQSVVCFAIGGLILFYIVAPRVFRFFSQMDNKKCNIIFAVVLGIFILDVIMSLVFPNNLSVV